MEIVKAYGNASDTEAEFESKKIRTKKLAKTLTDTPTKTRVKYASDDEISEQLSKNRKKTDDSAMTPMQLFQKFINKRYYRSDKKEYTHTSMAGIKGVYKIEEDQYQKFKSLYVNALMSGASLHITERHREFGPIVIDLDFVHSENKRQYTHKTIANIVRLYNYVIRKYLDVSDSKMTAYVLEKKRLSRSNGLYGDGLHIVYPYICTKPDIQFIIREDVIKLMTKNQIFDHMELIDKGTGKPTKNLEKVVDSNVIQNAGWLMYGSTKDKTSSVYEVTHIYQCFYKKIQETYIPPETRTLENTKHFVEVLSCRRFFKTRDLTFFRDGIDPEKLEIKRKELIGKLKKSGNTESAEQIGKDYGFIKAVEEHILVEAKNLVKLLSRKRADDRDSWFRVGCCLHNIDYRLLADWIEFSKKCPNKFKPGECEQLWKKMKESTYTIASLHFFARQDKPEAYVKLNRLKLEKLMEYSVNTCSHATIAAVIREKYQFRFRCASIKTQSWYEFDNHRWIENDSGVSLRKLIISELSRDYLTLAKKYNKEAGDALDGESHERDRAYDKINKINRLIRELGNDGYQNGIMRQAALLMHDKDFLKNLDENIYLLGFTNGVYDFEANTFRDGCPDDYISLCTGYNYIPYDPKDENAIAIMDFFKKIQPDKEMRRYLLLLLSTTIAGSICEESMYVMTGAGSNGKSKLFELLKAALGDLFKTMDVSVLVGKRPSSSSATPEIADKKGVRACTFDEPRARDEINAGFMKLFTSDTITARGLFKDPIYFKPQFKPFLLCNRLPKIGEDDDGTWRRIKVIPFPSRFWKRSDAPKNYLRDGYPKGHYEADLSLSDKMKEWKQMFMAILVEYYQIYKTESLRHPKIVTQTTSEYRRTCDIYQDFIGDYLEKTGDKSFLSIKSLHENMGTWFRANHQGKPPSAKELRNYVSQRLTVNYDAKKDTLTGYRYKTSDEDMDDGALFD
jgi:P4 family phage/plasmid primase-like protien